MTSLLRSLALCVGLAAAQASPASTLNGDRPEYAACIERASTAFRVSPTIIKLLLDVEGGRPGTESRNTNGSYDLGPMQINDRVWVKHVDRFGITRAQLRDDTCLNIYVGTWIFMQEFQRVKELGLALAHYHSKTGVHQQRYLGLVQRAIDRRLRRHADAQIASR